jgi:hypothetical protein
MTYLSSIQVGTKSTSSRTLESPSTQVARLDSERTTSCVPSSGGKEGADDSPTAQAR